MTDVESDFGRKLAAIVDGEMAPDAAIENLVDGASVITVDQDRFVFRPGGLCNAFLIILSGFVRVQLTSASGREVTLYRIGSGGSCVLTTSCLLGNESYPAEAIAETDVRAIAIPAVSFHAAMDASQTFRNFVFQRFSARLTGIIQKIEELSFTPIDARLAAALLEMNEKNVEKMTHYALAVELGTAREVVSRHLKRFEDNGWVRLGRGRVILLDFKSLQRIARE